MGALRELTRIAAATRRRRGAAPALIALLETATGCSGFSVDDSEEPFHFTLTAPAAAASARALIERIVAGEKPAFSTCALKFAEAAVAQP